MTTDIETRLRRYGTTLDNATSTHAEPISNRRQGPNVAELELGGHEGRPGRRTRSLIAAAGLVAAASVAFVATVNQRDTPAPAPAPVPAPASAPNAVRTEWPVRMAPGVTPWFELNDEIIATMALQAPEPGPAQGRLRCTSWTAESGTVICANLTGEGYLPAVTYPGTRGPDAKYVDISTLHADIDAATYASTWSQGKDVGYEDAPLPQQDVTIDGAPGRLIETSSGIRRVTWSPQRGVLVAIETGPGLTRDDLLAIAGNITPTTATPSMPLLLAVADVAAGQQAIALGGVIDGEVCLATATGCSSLQSETTASLSTQPTEFGIAGLASGDVATIRAVWPDGATADITPIPQPIGSTQVFVLSTNTPVTLTALDAQGNTIPDSELSTNPAAPATAPPTTVSFDPTSATSTIPLDAPPPLSTSTVYIDGSTPPLPQDVLDTLGIEAPVRYVFTAQDMRLYVVTPYDTRTGIVIDTGDGYIAGWFDDETVTSGLAYLSGTEPHVVAGIAPDDVTNIIVNGTDIPVVEHAWLAIPDSTVTSFTIVRTDGTRQTVDLQNDASSATTVPASTPPSAAG
jgi:hypothetical protein